MNKEEKVFLLTIDTEADDQWSEIGREKLSLRNISALPRLQALFNKYDIIPTYLVSYPVVNDDHSSGILTEFVQDKSCEIGAHLHSWDTPPYGEQNIRDARLNTELSDYHFSEKIFKLRDLLESRFYTQILSYRAGRWGITKSHFHILNKAGFVVDSSLRQDYPIHNREFGLYNHNLSKPFLAVAGCDLVEVVPTFYFNSRVSIIQKNSYIYRYKIFYLLVKKTGCGKFIWLRPYYSSPDEQRTIILNKKSDYFNMMFHSSEIIPGGSPYYSDWGEIDLFYENLENFLLFLREIFSIRSMGLSTYASEWSKENKSQLSE